MEVSIPFRAPHIEMQRLCKSCERKVSHTFRHSWLVGSELTLTISVKHEGTCTCVQYTLSIVRDKVFEFDRSKVDPIRKRRGEAHWPPSQSFSTGQPKAPRKRRGVIKAGGESSILIEISPTLQPLEAQVFEFREL